MDLAAQYNTTAPGGYVAMTYTEEKRAIRPVMIEDRILAVEQKFFCDRTTEKTVTLIVTYVTVCVELRPIRSFCFYFIFVKIDSKIIISLPLSKSVTQSVACH